MGELYPRGGKPPHVADGLEGGRPWQGRRGPGGARHRHTLPPGQVTRLVHGEKVGFLGLMDTVGFIFSFRISNIYINSKLFDKVHQNLDNNLRRVVNCNRLNISGDHPFKTYFVTGRRLAAVICCR